MKIAIASNNNICSQHFGHCQGFKVYEIEDNEIKKEYFLDSPGHQPGVLPKFLNDKGINIIVAGGMGSTAQKLFIDNNIQVIVGVSGKVDEIINKYLSNDLKSDGSVCDHSEN